MLESIPDNVSEQGNINHSPDPGVLRTISSEHFNRNRLDKDRTVFMKKLIEKSREEWPGKHIQGYIQLYSETPVFYLILLAEEILEYGLKSRHIPPQVRSRMKYLFLYLDATGSILKKFDRMLRRIYIYSLVMSGEKVDSPFEVASFASSSHTREDILVFLDKVVRNLKLLTVRRPVVDKMEMDFSLPLIQAACRGFNGVTSTVYLRMIFNAMRIGQVLTHLTIIHICSTHTVGTVKKKVKSVMKNKQDQVMALRGVSRLIHSNSMKQAKAVVFHLYMVFGLPYRPANMNTSLKFLGQSDLEVSYETDNKSEMQSVGNESKIVALKNSAFGAYFQKYRKFLFRISKPTKVKNKHFCKGFISYLFNFLLPYAPLFTAFQIKIFGICRDSNAPVENNWLIEKKYILKGRKHLPVPNYVQEKEVLHRQRLRERSNNSRKGTKVRASGVKKDSGDTENKSKRKKPKVAVDAEELNAQEIWLDKKSSTTKRGRNRFFTASKELEKKLHLHPKKSDMNSNQIKKWSRPPTVRKKPASTQVLKRVDVKSHTVDLTETSNAGESTERPSINSTAVASNNETCTSTYVIADSPHLDQGGNDIVEVLDTCVLPVNTTCNGVLRCYKDLDDASILFRANQNYPTDDFPNLETRVNDFTIYPDNFQRLMPYES
ncbi:hypothetical protein QAD02_013720 [Eretmocerus hayati]|uniref:Uncharacterized protein n=1 Tax=Eretmocerus hayati TaxID=131215 RepID=A0ACC2P386_9HYME|nr:hypothetical protein QAD02_013720 [Eretmocerus hayati]